ncbi:MAG: hypothetical protein IKX21_00825, partial [Deltaproteobacteria bacterium]|nr:hypothetical protein [Deltaproteobacteria bacterium]
DNSCGAALTRYSARPPIPIGTPSALPTPPAGSWRARMQRLVARAGDDYAVSPQVQGIAEAIMPLLAVACMEDIALVRTSNAAARLAQARNALQEISLRRGKLLDLLAKGLAPAEDIAERIAALKSEEDSLQAEIPRLAAAAANGSENALQQAYARLLAIRRGTLHPTIFRELFLRLYRGITIYAGTVVLHRRRGGDIFLEKYHQRQLCGMPPSTFRLEAFPEGGYKAEVTYYYASYFKGDETPHLIYIDDKIKVVALGYNYPYGYPRTPGAVRRKQAIAREKELLHPPVPGDAEPPADGS